jgi:hypothetical protein
VNGRILADLAVRKHSLSCRIEAYMEIASAAVDLYLGVPFGHIHAATQAMGDFLDRLHRSEV